MSLKPMNLGGTPPTPQDNGFQKFKEAMASVGGVIIVHLSHSLPLEEVERRLRTENLKWYDSYSYVHKVKPTDTHIEAYDALMPYRVHDMAPHLYVVDRVELLAGNDLWVQMANTFASFVVDRVWTFHDATTVMKAPITRVEDWPALGPDMYKPSKT